ncbi:uncharacterized protein BCR38DRAFT_339134 [Pseudomassariella vexata]|uniref:Rab-GAP TBC domain-containing protein n=1 Tax=Pseudomassariella vexata TaxID=1141098 RepID=A0A1Y2E4X1_9PEZI|nr:uncharacterized protein BCR38DRAFT_339134 [Pseudomassariella vexata]ORY66608.1 hypothetical protein BCR38DRAFT_339134 [Pseudomassariella vexata]
MTYDGASFCAVDLHTAVPSPGSPPGMSSSKSSKTSSLQSFGSDDDNSVLADVGHFEEIGLDDDTVTIDSAHQRDTSQVKSNPNPYSSSYSSDLRAQSTKHVGPKIHPTQPSSTRELARPQLQRSITGSSTKVKPKFPSLTTQFRDTSTANLNSIGPQPAASTQPIRGLSARSASTMSQNRRRRSPSPSNSACSLSPRDPHMGPNLRRRSWQSSREKKSVGDLEREAEDDEDDDIPDGMILDNVPISPRPARERTASRPVSASTSPERTTKERVRSVGNGTPAVAAAQGCLRSPSWKSEESSAASARSSSTGPSPVNGRAKSWTAAHSYLSAEAKALTEKLEEYADVEEKSANGRPVPKPRVKSALAELPPLRRTNIMIDPLPVSKEKEAVLSRTRPSWLPPKNPAEEKRHLKEYQKLVASSVEADKRREQARLQKELTKENRMSQLARVWEEDILKRWDDAIRERKTRESWWKGVAPRCRGAVWAKAIGNELGLTPTSFKAALKRAREVETRVAEGQASIEDERKAGWFKMIRRDVEERTWVDLKIFDKAAPLHQSLLDVLSAWAMYRSDIGYIPGCNTIAALILLNLHSAADSFIVLANILNRPLPLSFYVNDQGAKSTTYNLLLQTLAKKAGNLHYHLTRLADPEVYLAELFTSLFTQHRSLDEASRLWDVYVFEGDSVLVRAGLALLMEKEGSLLAAKTVDDVCKVLAENQRLQSQEGREDEWVKAVREAGKA